MIFLIQKIVNNYYRFTSAMRVYIYSRFFPIGKDTIILSRFSIRNPKELSIGSGCFININFFAQASGGISLGDDVTVGPNVSIYSENHKFDNLRKKIKEQGFSYKKVRVGNNVWIGANVIILPGVTLADGCIVGAGAVVTKSFPKNSIIAGVPAKLIKRRGK